MKFTIQPHLPYPEIEDKLKTQFPNYETSMRSNQFLVVKKSSIYGANIIVRKGKMIVNGNFPTMGTQLVFTLCFILLGIVIPLIIYFLVFHKNFKALEQEVGDFLKAAYGTGD